MKNIIVLFFVILLLVDNYVIAQDYDGVFSSGLIFEPTLLSTELVSETNTKMNKGFLAYGLCYSAKIRISSNYQFEFRPGFIWGQEFYFGLQFGFAVRRNLGDGYFAVADFVNLLRAGDNSEDVTNTYQGGLGVGKRLSEQFAVILSVSKTFNTYFGQHWEDDDYMYGRSLRRTYYDAYCDLIFGLKLEFNFR